MQPTIKDLKVFSLIWVMIFAIIAFYSPVINWSSADGFKIEYIKYWALICAVLFILEAIFTPPHLKSFYVLWVEVGEKFGKIFSLIIMLLMFYIMFTPISIILKLTNKDLLKTKRNYKCDTYWVNRENQPGSFKDQF